MRKLLAALIVGGCAPVSAVSVGPAAEPRPENCHIREELLTPKDAESRYRQVGVVCWSEGSQAREDRDHAACRLGGDVIVRVGLCTNGEGRFSTRGTEYGVYLAE
jgi:hypothetical protein